MMARRRRRRERGTRADDVGMDTFERAVGDTVEFRVDTATHLARLELVSGSARRWLMVIAVLLALNWLHDLGAATEMFDWWDGRENGLLSSEFEHEVAVLTPLLLAIIPILWGRRRDRVAKREQDQQQE